MHILGNILVFIVLVVILYKIGSAYQKRKDEKSFQKRLRDEIRKQNRNK